MVNTAEVLIIGAGALGSSTAYWLALKGIKKITVLEKSGPGNGATGHAAGLIRHHYPDRELVRMVQHCTARFKNFKEEMGVDIDYVNNGFCYLNPPDAKGVEEIARMQREVGVPIELLSPEQIRHLHPKGEINTDGVGSGFYDPEAGYADPYKVAVGYAERAKQLGVQLVLGTSALGFEVVNNRITKVLTDNGTYSADLVINAAGLGADKLNQELDIDLPLKAFSLGHGMLIPDIPFEPGVITINDASVEEFLFFCRPESGGTALIGMDLEDPNRELNLDSYNMEIPFDKIGRYYEHLIKRMPFLSTFRISTVFGALDVKTPDWNPGMGFYDNGPDNYYQIVAGSGHAFKLAPVIGEVASQQILGEKLSFDISVFDINRLSQFDDSSFSGSFFINQ